jgi:hypothetical protein
VGFDIKKKKIFRGELEESRGIIASRYREERRRKQLIKANRCMKNNWIVDIQSENYGPRKCLVTTMIAWIAARLTTMMNSSESGAA